MGKLRLIVLCAGVIFLNDMSATETFSLDTLLEGIRSEYQSEKIEDSRRIENFALAKSDQEAALNDIKVILSEQEDKAQRLEQTFNKNDKALINLDWH